MFLMPNEVFETEYFSRLFEALSEKEKEWIKRMVEQLKESSKVGKPLRFDWFREKKFEGNRLFYLIYSDLHKVLLVAYGEKKEQQKIIDEIVRNKAEYKKLVEGL